MNKAFVLKMVLVGLPIVALAQIDTPRIPPDVDTHQLYTRASSSDFVVVGRVTNIAGIGDRIDRTSKEQILASMDNPLVGQLFEITVEETICTREEFAAPQGQANNVEQTAPRKVSIFIPIKDPFFTGPNRQEVLLRNHQYALFLVAVGSKVTTTWTDSFELSPKTTYYRAEELSRGVVPLAGTAPGKTEPAQPPVLLKVRKLCSAMKPIAVEDKMTRLQELIASDDPDLQREAQMALDKIREEAKQ